MITLVSMVTSLVSGMLLYILNLKFNFKRKLIERYSEFGFKLYSMIGVLVIGAPLAAIITDKFYNEVTFGLTFGAMMYLVVINDSSMS